MKRITLQSILAVSFLFFSMGMAAQNSSFWTAVSENDVASQQLQQRVSTPADYELFRLNSENLSSALHTAPQRSEVATSNVIIQLPNENGELQNFKVARADVLSEGLRARFPNIGSYVAQGIDDPTAIARFSYSTIGLHVMITSGVRGTYYMDPYTADNSTYIGYARRDVSQTENNFACLIDDNEGPELDAALFNADDGMLRTYRLAIGATGEYSQFHLNQQGVPSTATDEVKKEAVLSAMNVTMTRVNGLFERDAALTMIIIDNNTDIIFLNASSDPYTNNSAFALLDENQETCDDIIGSENYDIGHVFSTGGGGVAQLNSPCTTSKARGVTGTNSPINDPFDVDYVAHEMGHQWGATHTFNNSCGGNRTNSTAYEPGSGSTIMAYAGICGPNVQNASDDYFHAASINQMWNNISAGSGSTCAMLSETMNAAPIADAGENYVIPPSTPFVLTGTGTDSDGDALTYCWEQYDNQIATMPPSTSSTVGPTFRSLDPSTDTQRFFPDFERVLLNGSTGTTWERLPAVSRIMRFRLTVRDNVAGGAGTASDNTIITVNDTDGPFAVTSPTATAEWQINSTQTVTWDVAGTDSAPFNTPTVDILLSVNNGESFDFQLATGVSNNGSADITVPDIPFTDEAKIMVRSVDNVFYALNAGQFDIDPSLSAEEFAFDNFALWPNPANGTFNLSFIPETSDKVEVALYDIRGRVISQQTFENVSGTFSESFDASKLNTGMYFVKITNGDKQLTSKLMKN